MSGRASTQVPIIEVIGGTERTGFLDASSEGIVAEGRGANAGIHDLGQSVLEVPGEAAALGVGQGIAVCVVGAKQLPHPLATVPVSMSQ